jgi:hypothetical protein
MRKELKRVSKMFDMKAGDKAKADPILTGLENWVEGTVISVKNNPFKGTVIAIKDNLNRIFFGEEKYFTKIDEPCLQ